MSYCQRQFPQNALQKRYSDKFLKIHKKIIVTHLFLINETAGTYVTPINDCFCISLQIKVFEPPEVLWKSAIL